MPTLVYWDVGRGRRWTAREVAQARRRGEEKSLVIFLNDSESFFRTLTVSKAPSARIAFPWQPREQ